MWKLIPAVLISAALSAAQSFADVEYFKKVEGKDKADKLEGSLNLDTSAKVAKFLSKNREILAVQAGTITNVVYERASKPRYAAGLLLAWPLLFTKSKSHFVTIQYSEKGTGQYAVFRLDKGNYREVLAAMEAFTGKPVKRDEEK